MEMLVSHLEYSSRLQPTISISSRYNQGSNGINNDNNLYSNEYIISFNGKCKSLDAKL